MRTIILASWDAEEYGLIGSTEFAEDHGDWLSDKSASRSTHFLSLTLGSLAHRKVAGSPGSERLRSCRLRGILSGADGSAVAYLNMDESVTGSRFAGGASPVCLPRIPRCHVLHDFDPHSLSPGCSAMQRPTCSRLPTRARPCGTRARTKAMPPAGPPPLPIRSARPTLLRRQWKRHLFASKTS